MLNSQIDLDINSTLHWKEAFVLKINTLLSRYTQKKRFLIVSSLKLNYVSNTLETMIYNCYKYGFVETLLVHIHVFENCFRYMDDDAKKQLIH